MPAEELARNDASQLPQLCAERHLEWFHLPVADEQVPLADFDRAWDGRQLGSMSCWMPASASPFTARVVQVVPDDRSTHPDRPRSAARDRHRPRPRFDPRLSSIRRMSAGSNASAHDGPPMLNTLGLFVITAIAEIVGCYLPYLWLKQGKSIWLLVPAALSLALFAWLLSLHPTAAGGLRRLRWRLRRCRTGLAVAGRRCSPHRVGTCSAAPWRCWAWRSSLAPRNL